MTDQRSTPPTGAENAGRAAPRHLEGLEGTRGIATMAVVAVHTSVHFAPAVIADYRIDFLGQALTYFFTLSGFLLYLPHVKRVHGGRSRPDTATYLRHRVMRIFPVYVCIFLVANFVLQVAQTQNPYTLGWGNIDEGVGMITDPVTLLANLTLTQTLFPGTLQTGIPPSWSLTVEYGYYLALPLLALALYPLARSARRPLTVAIWPPVLLAVLGVVTNTVVGVLQHNLYPGPAILDGYWGPNWVAVLSRSFFALADNFAFGMLAAVVYVAVVHRGVTGSSMRRLRLVATVVLFTATLASMVLFALAPRYVHTLFAVASAALVLLLVLPTSRERSPFLTRTMEWPPLRYLGTISLSAYLWHYPVVLLVERAGLKVEDTVAGLLLAFGLVAGITVAFAALSYHFVERPAMRYRR